MGPPLRLELTLVGLLVKLSKQYTTRDAHGTSGGVMVSKVD